MNRATSATGILLSVAVVLAAVSVLLGMAGYRTAGVPVAETVRETDESTEWDDEAVLSTARAAIEAVLSYQWDTAATELEQAGEAYTTGDFRDSFDQMVRDVVVPQARERQLSSVATVAAIGLMSRDDTGAEVLAFVNQSATTAGADPVVTDSSVKVHLVDDDGRLLVDEFVPV